MKVLVVDDKVLHLQGAREQLVGHDLVTTDSYEEAIGLLAEDTDLEVLLSDLLMPAEPYALGTEGLKYLGHEMPIGLVLALRAALVGVKMVAVITDANHHNHPMSAALDWITPAYWTSDKANVLNVNGSRVLIAHAGLDEHGRKNWQAALDVLTLGKKE